MAQMNLGDYAVYQDPADLLHKNSRWYSSRVPVQLYLNRLSYLVVAVLLVVAFRAWLKRSPTGLPKWRWRVGLASLLVVLADWLSVILFIVIRETNIHWLRYFDDTVFNFLTLSALVAILLATTLVGRARVYAVAAGFCMFVFWVTSMVY